MLYLIDNLGQWGILRDGLPHELPDNAWSEGRNVRFREGYAEKFTGHSEAWGASPVVPYHVAALQDGTTRWWIEAGLNAIYSVNNVGVHTSITGTPPTGNADNRWTSTVMSGIAVLNNGKDLPQMWAGTGSMANLSDWPMTLRAKSIRAFRNFLVAVNVSKDSGANWYPHMVKWSSVADPGTVPDSWDETDPTKDTGEGDLADHPSELVDSLVMGDALIIYKEQAYFSLTDTGDSRIFRAQMISPEMGMLARNCAANFPGGHVVLGQGDVYVHSGGAPETILTSRARRWLFNNLDADNYGRAFVAPNPLANEVWICFPSIGQSACDLALVWNWKANTLGTRELPNATHVNTGVVDSSLASSWDSLVGPWDALEGKWNQSATTKTSTRTVIASANSQMLLADSGSGFASTPMTAYLERTGLSFGRPDAVKLCRGVRPIFEGSMDGEVSISIGAAMEPQATPTWSDPVPFKLGSDIKADSFACGRYLAVRIESDTMVNWRLKQMSVDLEIQGGY
jgi:hypothetical protein